ncbi:hypothetical protein [uncultured Methanobrevibacter sp.]|uniref:hypothetical protein n=1 Tax=uncultured Methanobrevibacter sp. TaxID=253161 RepID=UPI00261084EC|nr:hypothetical protein [uncultured Methanobrevibacter sp.]
MNIKKIVLISIIAVAVIASVTVVSAGLFDGLLGGEQKDNVIEIDNITFNTTNVTKFKLFNTSEDEYGCINWYVDENDTGYNIHIFNYTNLDKSDFISFVTPTVIEQFDNKPSQTVDGIVVYTTSANSGDHAGEPRYATYIEHRDLKTIVDIWSPDPNETAKMASTLKFK